MSFNSEDDLDLIREIEAINSINSDADLDNKSAQFNNKSNMKNNIDKSSKSNSPTPSRKKRRPPKKANFTPKLDLDALLGPSENIANDNDINNFLNLSPRNESMISSPKESVEVTSASISLLEARLFNHANEAFQKLTEDFLFELQSMFSDDFHLQSIIYTYLMSLLSDIRSEIRFVNESFEFPQIDINFELDVNSFSINKRRKKNYFNVHPYVDRISDLKLSLSQNMKKTQINLNHEIQSRDIENVASSQNNNSKSQYMSQLKNKEYQMRKRLYELNFTLELYEKYNHSIKQKFEDFEAAEFLKQQKIDDSFIIQQNFEQFKEEITKINIKLENKRLISKIKQIIEEKNEIQQSIDALYLNIKSFFTSNNSSYNNFLNFNSYRLNYQSYDIIAQITLQFPLKRTQKFESPYTLFLIFM